MDEYYHNSPTIEAVLTKMNGESSGGGGGALCQTPTYPYTHQNQTHLFFQMLTQPCYFLIPSTQSVVKGKYGFDQSISMAKLYNE